MKPLRNRLQEARKHLGIPWDVLERDYLLSWVLAGIGQMAPLNKALVFKGGTALKKCYFGDYRFSEDLDFSTVGESPSGKELEEAMDDACAAAAELLDEYAPVEIRCERYAEKEPHPGGQEAFTIRARFPWQREPLTRVMVEITVDEKVLADPVERAVMHEYGEDFDARILVYSLEEIIAEKLRAILQHAQRLKERGWGRSRARDYYDRSAFPVPLPSGRSNRACSTPSALHRHRSGHIIISVPTLKQQVIVHWGAIICGQMAGQNGPEWPESARWARSRN